MFYKLYNKKMLEKIEWITLNIGTGIAFLLDNYLNNFGTLIGIIALACFNFARAYEVFQRTRRDNSDHDDKRKDK
jgi:hypothetical protein